MDGCCAGRGGMGVRVREAHFGFVISLSREYLEVVFLN